MSTDLRTLAARGHAVRMERYQLRLAMKAGEVTLAEAFDWPCVRRMDLWKLLRCLPHVGPITAHHVPKRLGISSVRPVGDLTERQRRDVERELGLALEDEASA